MLNRLRNWNKILIVQISEVSTFTSGGDIGYITYINYAVINAISEIYITIIHRSYNKALKTVKTTRHFCKKSNFEF